MKREKYSIVVGLLTLFTSHVAIADEVVIKVLSGSNGIKYEDHQNAGFSILISNAAKFRVDGNPTPSYEIVSEGANLRLRFLVPNQLQRFTSGGLGEFGVSWGATGQIAVNPTKTVDTSPKTASEVAKENVDKNSDLNKQVQSALASRGLGFSSQEEVKNNIKNFVLDFDIPDSPGFVVIGASSQKIVHPKSIRDLSAAIINGVDESGKVKSGLALDFQPMALFNRNISLEQFKREYDPKTNFLGYAAFNTSASIATLQGTTDNDKSMKLGLGLHIPLMNKNDSRFDNALLTCYEEIFRDIENNVPVTRDIKAPSEKDKPKQAASLSNCYKKRDVRWNAESWILGLGRAWTSDTGDFKDRKPTTSGIWTSYASPIQENAQIVLHARAMNGERIADTKNTGKFISQNSSILGVSFKAGTDTFSSHLQLSYQRIKPDGREQDQARRVALGLDIRLAKDMWLSTSIGGEGGRKDGENKHFVLSGLKFGSGSSQLFSPDK